jgi:hypothetical protein
VYVDPAPERQAAKICDMRTYPHVVFTWTMASLTRPSEPGVMAWSVVDAVLPGLLLSPERPGSARRRERFTRGEFCKMACEKGPFGEPDAAPHSAVPVVAPLAFYLASSTKGLNPHWKLMRLALLLGWVTCSLTRSSPPGMCTRSSGPSQSAVLRVPSPAGTVTTTPAPSRSSSTRHCSGLRRGSCHEILVARSGWVLLLSVFG